jgi:hypothetical protein
LACVSTGMEGEETAGAASERLDSAGMEDRGSQDVTTLSAAVVAVRDN